MDPVLVPTSAAVGGVRVVGEALAPGEIGVERVDDGSFEAFYERERAQALRTAWLITGDGEVAGDLTQEAFARAYARWSRLAGHDLPGAWLRRVVVRLAVRHRDRRGREQPAVAATEGRGGSGGEPAGRTAPDVERVDVVGALGALSPQQRAVVVLHHLYDLPVAEVARELRVSEGTVKTQLHRARGRLGALLEVDDHER